MKSMKQMNMILKDIYIFKSLKKQKKKNLLSGKFKVIDQLDQEHLKQQKLKKIQKYICLLFFTTTVLGVRVLCYIMTNYKLKTNFKTIKNQICIIQMKIIWKYVMGELWVTTIGEGNVQIINMDVVKFTMVLKKKDFIEIFPIVW